MGVFVVLTHLVENAKMKPAHQLSLLESLGAGKKTRCQKIETRYQQQNRCCRQAETASTWQRQKAQLKYCVQVHVKQKVQVHAEQYQMMLMILVIKLHSCLILNFIQANQFHSSKSNGHAGRRILSFPTSSRSFISKKEKKDSSECLSESRVPTT